MNTVNHRPDKIDWRTITREMGKHFGEKNKDFDFFKRVYANGLEVYMNRLKRIGFTDQGVVLDAGAGFGQWSLALSRLNNTVIALESNSLRCDILQLVLAHTGIKNVHVVKGSIEYPPFEMNSLDSVFSYSVIYQTRWRMAVIELGKVLKPGGWIYLSASGFGWMLFNLFSNWNPSVDFNPRIYALKSMAKTLSHGLMFRSGDWVLSPGGIKKTLSGNGFSRCQAGGDGKIHFRDIEAKCFYPGKKYGLPNVFEVMARKDD